MEDPMFAMLQQQCSRLSAKVAPLVMASSLLQEAMNVNQQLLAIIKSQQDTITSLKTKPANELKPQGPVENAGEVSETSQPTA